MQSPDLDTFIWEAKRREEVDALCLVARDSIQSVPQRHKKPTMDEQEGDTEE